MRKITKECLIVPKNAFKFKTGTFLEKEEFFKFSLTCNTKKNEEEEEENCMQKVLIPILIIVENQKPILPL